MATNFVNCTIVGHTSGYSTFADYSTSPACYAGYNNYNYYAYVLKFTTPSFAGASENINFNIWMYKGIGTNVTLRYAICSSDANKNLYCETSSAVTDSYQIKTGTVSLSNMTSTTERRTITVSTTGLHSNKTYYLILWAYNDTGVELREINSAWGSYSITTDYILGVVWIDNGSSFEPYQCYIDNGTSWDLYLPYYDNGTTWEPSYPSSSIGYYFNNGDQCSDITGGWTNTGWTYHSDPIAASTISDTKMTVAGKYNGSSLTSYSSIVGTVNQINLDNVSKIYADINITKQGTVYLRVCSTTNVGNSAASALYATVGLKTYELDVSSLTGDYYVIVVACGTSGYGYYPTADVLRVWSE